jgi:hypothetical protein
MELQEFRAKDLHDLANFGRLVVHQQRNHTKHRRQAGAQRPRRRQANPARAAHGEDQPDRIDAQFGGAGDVLRPGHAAELDPGATRRAHDVTSGGRPQASG